MEELSELERFLQSQQSEGQDHGESSFTLAKEKALQKLADFQLPFAGAWAVKVFQALISSGANTEIRIQQTRRVTVIRCSDGFGRDFDQIEAAFFDPRPTQERTLNHLISALWEVGVGGLRAFQLCLPDREECLFWDGSHLHRLGTRIG